MQMKKIRASRPPEVGWGFADCLQIFVRLPRPARLKCINIANCTRDVLPATLCRRWCTDGNCALHKSQKNGWVSRDSTHRSHTATTHAGAIHRKLFASKLCSRLWFMVILNPQRRNVDIKLAIQMPSSIISYYIMYRTNCDTYWFMHWTFIALRNEQNFTGNSPGSYLYFRSRKIHFSMWLSYGSRNAQTSPFSKSWKF